jgi:predicted deacetylase
MPAVPEELMTRLHEANEHLEHARKQLDSAQMFNTDESRAAAAALRKAEAELEEVTQEINRFLPPTAAAGPEPGSNATL